MMLRCVDAETCGFPPDDGQIVEVGWTDIYPKGDGWVVSEPSAMLINPERAIPAVSSAIHHIVDEDVKDAPLLIDAIAASDLVRDDVFAFVAHRATFERAVLPLGDVRWICSWKISVTLAPNAPSHSNQALRYFLKLNLDREKASPPHRAGPDSYVTAHLIARALAKMTPEQMIEVTAAPLLLPKLHFGKHAGEPCASIPADYWEWILKNVIDDEDVQFTAKTYLADRRAAQRSRSPV